MPESTTDATSAATAQSSTPRKSVRPPVPARPPRESDGLGAVFTRRWAAELVLDLAGYTPDKNLAAGQAIEPSCGGGAFLVPMIERLAKSCADHGLDLAETGDAIAAWDLNPASVAEARDITRTTLRDHGMSPAQAARLARRWVREGDFLLAEHQPADWVVGNPPYVRLEDVPSSRSAAYRDRWDTMQGRADVFVGFIQAGLETLQPDGVLSFICADRWMKNQYGKRLREQIESDYAVDTVVTLHDSDAFEERVYAYPAIFAIRASQQGPALVVDADATFGPDGACEVARLHAASTAQPETIAGDGFTAAWTQTWFAGAQSWPTGDPDKIALVAALESRYPALGDPDCGIRLGIGLATGADTIYLTKNADVVEMDRLLPVAMAADLSDGTVAWSGTYLISPWDQDGRLVELRDFTRLRRYMNRHRDRLQRRHVAQRQPTRWHRTIDKPVAGLAETPKLLLPDLRPRVAPVLEDGHLYPQHNLFWITSETWDLRVLGGLLLSQFGTMFVETYSPRMAGGALRVTAQYLRRIRVPHQESIDPTTKARLVAAFEARDVSEATLAACDAYGVPHARFA